MPTKLLVAFGARSLVAVVLGVMAIAVTGCRDTGRDGALFEIAGKLFVFNYRVATATYVVTLKPLRPMADGQVAVASFEDPAGGEPIVVEQKVWPKLDKVTLESPPLRCIVKDRPYAVAVVIRDPAGNELQKLETTLVSDANQAEMLPDAPLVVGPLYTANPELSGHPDGRLPGNADEACGATAERG